MCKRSGARYFVTPCRGTPDDIQQGSRARQNRDGAARERGAVEARHRSERHRHILDRPQLRGRALLAGAFPHTGLPSRGRGTARRCFCSSLSRRAGARAQTVRGGARSRERRPVGYEFPVRSPRRRGALDELERPRSFRRGVSPAQAGQDCGYLRGYHRAPRSRGPPASQRSTTDIRSPSAHQIEYFELAFVANR